MNGYGQPHRRKNPLTGRWVLVSPQRISRPWQGQRVLASAPVPIEHDPSCFLCANNLRVGGQRNPDYRAVHVFDNDFPALPAGAADWSDDDPLFGAQGARGTSRVICFSPNHGLTMAGMAPSAIREVIDCWCDQTAELGRDHANVQLFENKGEMMGCSNPHPHGQVWATSHIPGEIADEDHHQRGYAAKYARPLLLDLAVREAGGDRVVVQNTDWLAIVPWWASWPFEVLLLPRFAVQQMPQLSAGQRDSCAEALAGLLARYDALFGVSFPYSMGWHGAPFIEGDAAHWQLHAHFYPPLLRSATVRKFMVGYEMLAEAQRDVTPERAAEMLRTAIA
jgi:UDPglucose--hexose-1-phosphate uridylyltransferase